MRAPSHFSDETLKAYVDDKLDPDTRSAIQRALAEDAVLAGRLQRVRDPRSNEPAGTALKGPAPVLSLAAHRAARDTPPPSPSAPSHSDGWTWVHWVGMAAGLTLGVLIGRFAGPGAPGAMPAGFVLDAGRLLARGEVQNALDTKPAGAPRSTPSEASDVAIQVSFVDHAGAYCRSFSTPAHAGLACREGEGWVLHLWTDAAPPSASARDDLPRAVQREINHRIAGNPLDASGEQKAIRDRWER